MTMRAVSAVGRFLRKSPLTFIWLAILLATTVIQHIVPPRELNHILVHRSTNIHHLSTEPLTVIAKSLFWLDGGGRAAFWVPYALAYLVFHVPAERWLGSLRWLIVGLAGHVLATFISEGALAAAIKAGIANEAMRNTSDVGVSYFLAAVTAVLVYHIVRPWRWVYLAGVLVFYGVPLLVAPNFTALGHFSSVLIGLACYPLAASRMNDQWDPLAALGRLRDRLPGARRLTTSG